MIIKTNAKSLVVNKIDGSFSVKITGTVNDECLGTFTTIGFKINKYEPIITVVYFDRKYADSTISKLASKITDNLTNFVNAYFNAYNKPKFNITTLSKHEVYSKYKETINKIKEDTLDIELLINEIIKNDSELSSKCYRVGDQEVRKEKPKKSDDDNPIATALGVGGLVAGGIAAVCSIFS